VEEEISSDLETEIARPVEHILVLESRRIMRAAEGRGWVGQDGGLTVQLDSGRRRRR
jgi:hypothetical protein